MVSKGLLVRLKARPGKEQEVEGLLASVRALVVEEPATSAWFGIRLGRGEYGIFDVFPDEAGRQAHLSGAVAEALGQRAEELFSEPPRIQPLDVLADKLATSTPAPAVTKGVLLTFRAKSGRDADVAEFLRGSRLIADAEPATVAWFAIHLDDGSYGIFDVFPDASGRFRHLTGRVPRELVKHGLRLLGSFPDLKLLNVVAHRLAD